jgi:hypothetical protein
MVKSAAPARAEKSNQQLRRRQKRLFVDPGAAQADWPNLQPRPGQGVKSAARPGPEEMVKSAIGSSTCGGAQQPTGQINDQLVKSATDWSNQRPSGRVRCSGQIANQPNNKIMVNLVTVSWSKQAARLRGPDAPPGGWLDPVTTAKSRDSTREIVRFRSIHRAVLPWRNCALRRFDAST